MASGTGAHRGDQRHGRGDLQLPAVLRRRASRPDARQRRGPLPPRRQLQPHQCDLQFRSIIERAVRLHTVRRSNHSRSRLQCRRRLKKATSSTSICILGGRLDPETGLQLNRNRFYASHLGRWVNRDPILYEGSPWTLYEYLRGQPTIWTDPTGKQMSGIGIIPNPGSRWLCESDEDKCKNWVENEKKNQEWLDDLPDCPCLS